MSTAYRFLACTALVAGATAPNYAAAHIDLLSPPSRYGHQEQKEGPCGRQDGERGSVLAAFVPGATIRVRWEETIDHPGHFRLAFDNEGDDGFVDPVAVDDFYANSAVLLDEIEDQDGGIYEISVTLPDVECDRCTLQLVQVMTDKLYNGFGGSSADNNDLYYACSDLVLSEAAPAEGCTWDASTGSCTGDLPMDAAAETEDATAVDHAADGTHHDDHAAPTSEAANGDVGSGCQAGGHPWSLSWWLSASLAVALWRRPPGQA